ELIRMLGFLVATIAYGGVWLAAAFLFSILFRAPATAALAALGLWLVFSFFWSLIIRPLAATLIAGPQEDIFGPNLAYIQTSQVLDRISPNTLYARMFGDGTVYLIGMDGNVAHSWHMPYRPGLCGYLLDNGDLFYDGKVMEDLDRFEAWPRFKGGAVLEADWSGRILWEVRHADHHHDARRLKNGNVLLLCLRPLPAEIGGRVRGGLPGSEAGGTIYADYLIEMTTIGEVVWEWRS